MLTIFLRFSLISLVLSGRHRTTTRTHSELLPAFAASVLAAFAADTTASIASERPPPATRLPAVR